MKARSTFMTRGVIAAVGVSALLVLAESSGTAVVENDGFVRAVGDGLQGGAIIDRPDQMGTDAQPAVMMGRETQSAATGAGVQQLYPFFPQAGTLWRDLYINNHVDLGGGSTPFDFDCTDRTYLGHKGHDSDISGFREQAIGVPVFAALDGTVVAAHDGEPDMNTQALGQLANYVVLDHGNGQTSWYYHLKKNSVVVSVGQVVPSGRQIGLTGSSGSSTWPHLHFESQLNGSAYEPSAGPCRPGASFWVNQIPVLQTPFVRTFTFGNADFVGNAGYPFDQVAHTGSYVLGASTTYFRLQLGNVPVASTYQVRYERPDGTTALNFSDTFGNNTVLRDSWFWFRFTLGGNLNMLGTWTVTFSVNGTPVATAPFFVVATPAELVNHPPLPVSVVLDLPASSINGVPFCRVTPASLYRRDPDYDLVRYEFKWSINGAVVRDVTSAALADAIPKGLARAGDRLTCTVTPFDDALPGPSASASFPRATSGDFDGDSKADVAIFRPSTGEWFVRQSSTFTPITLVWGGGADKPVPGDYDGDGIADVAVFRPSTGEWFVRQSSTFTLQTIAWGGGSDIPVQADYDGDGKTDVAIFRPSTGEWFIRQSSTFSLQTVVWGGGSDIPVQADYDGDGKTDVAIFRPPTGEWFVRQSSTFTLVTLVWGGGSDKPVAGDYDGDGKADLAVFRASTGEWFVRQSRTFTLLTMVWGGGSDIPVPGDYDGDGKFDVAIFRRSTGEWFVRQSSTFTLLTIVWGGGADIPILQRP